MLRFTVRWVCGQRLNIKRALSTPYEPLRTSIDVLLVTLVEGVIAEGANEPSFQVEYSLDGTTWVYVSHRGAPEGEPQVKCFVVALTEWFFKLTSFYYDGLVS